MLLFSFIALLEKHQILAHRGCHYMQDFQKNSLTSLLLALEKGFGIETDLRDYKGDVYISHDPIIEPHLSLGAFLDSAKNFFPLQSSLALNIKSDGLSSMICDLLPKVFGDDISSVYFFDASVPDSLSYIEKGLPVYTRLSEYELFPSFAHLSSGVWVDNFDGSFDQFSAAVSILNQNKNCTLVSPELHGRDHFSLWKSLRDSGIVANSLLQLCTDFPEEAAEYFAGK